MSTRSRTMFAAVCVLALIGFSRDAHALPIGNDVDLDWSNTRFASSDEFITILGMPRLILEADDPANLLFDIDVIAPDELDGFNLIVQVVDAGGNEFEAGLQLRYPLVDTYATWDTFINDGNPLHALGQLSLSEFSNFDRLPLAGNWIYLLSGSFNGNPSVGDGEVPVPPLPPYTGPLRISITASGAGTPIDTQPVPEPGTLSLLLIGAAAAGLRRTRRRG